MTQGRFRLGAWDFSSADGHALPSGGIYFAFANCEAMSIADGSMTTPIEPDQGRFLPPGAMLQGRGWLFALTRHDSATPPDTVAQIELAAGITLDENGSHLLRVDAVSSPSGAITPRHGHRGPGIRRLEKGLLMAEVGECMKRIRPGEAWFESGPEWVVGSNISEGENTFIRIMVLPAELDGGKSSFVPASPEDAAAPRAVRYRLLGEMVC
ncbi:hypothetical protein ACLBWS_13615 [Brucellaceae bacterium D45D]